MTVLRYLKTVAHVYTPRLEQRDGLGGPLHLMGVDALGSVRAWIQAWRVWDLLREKAGCLPQKKNPP